MTLIDAEDTNEAEIAILVEDLIGALSVWEPTKKINASRIVAAVQGGMPTEILPEVLKSRGARLIFERMRRQSQWGFSSGARAASSTSEGVRRVLGESELMLFPQPEHWDLVITLPARRNLAPSVLVASLPNHDDEDFATLHLNEPISGYIQQILDKTRHSKLLDLLLAPESQLSLH